MENVVILGAGAAGMSAAYELYRNNKKAIIIEKDSQVGGLAKTYQLANSGQITGRIGSIARTNTCMI